MTEWRDIPGFEARYQVSDDGRVKSVARRCASWRGESRRVNERILKPYLCRRYLAVNMSVEGVRSFRTIHRLVATVLLGPQPFLGAEVCHNDGNALNNNLSNLRWDTASENRIDAVRHGTNWQTAKTHCPQGHPYTPENTRAFTNPSNGRPGRRCVTCQRDQQRAKPRKRSRTTTSLPVGDPRHGTPTGYTYWRCRCHKCRAYIATYARQRRKQSKAVSV